MELTDADEVFAWKSALGIMLFLSAVALGLEILQLSGLPVSAFFPIDFIAAFVYLPTVVLFAGWVSWRRKYRAGLES